MNKLFRIFLLMALSALLMRCAVTPLAGGSDNPDFIVAGAIVDTNGLPARDAIVTIVPTSYNPVTDSLPPASMTDTTNSAGAYRLSVTHKGIYTVQAVHRVRRTRSLTFGVQVLEDTCRVGNAILSIPGSIKIVPLSKEITSGNGYVFIPGTSLWAPVKGFSDTVVLDSVPAGLLPCVSYAAARALHAMPLRYNVPIASGAATVVVNTDWKYSRNLSLNTTPAGADVSGAVFNFPVLIRLSGDNFDFSQAQRDGADIRFTKSDNSPLRYEIDRWDSLTRQAEIWVRIDTVLGNNNTQSLAMYWGSAAAADSSGPAAVFDTATGFAGVWHMGKPAGATIPDATARRNFATARVTSTVSGAIGTAQLFNGVSSYVQASAAQSAALNYPETGVFSVSAWVNASVLDSAYHGIVYKSNFQYGLQIRPENNWEFFNYRNVTGWEGSRYPASVNAWHLLTGVRNGARQYLFLDGACVDSAKTLQPSKEVRTTDSPIEIGHCPDGGRDPDRFFNGAIDEVRVNSVALSSDWIKLCFMNQKEKDALVKW